MIHLMQPLNPGPHIPFSPGHGITGVSAFGGDVEPFFEQLRYRFRDEALSQQALTHSSYGNENHCSHYERLEFLGDSILGFLIAQELFQRYPEAGEGDLSKQKSVLVSTPSLAAKARELDLARHLRIGEGERRSGGYEKESILADLVESVIAALFLDGGLERARSFVLGLFQEELSLPDLNLKESQDFKTLLQERLQGRGWPLPEYAIVLEEGPAHHRVFAAEVQIGGFCGPRGMGRTKKAAHQDAARLLLQDESFWNSPVIPGRKVSP